MRNIREASFEALHLGPHGGHLGAEAGAGEVPRLVAAAAEDELVREVAVLVPQPAGVLAVPVRQERSASGNSDKTISGKRLPDYDQIDGGT